MTELKNRYEVYEVGKDQELIPVTSTFKDALLKVLSGIPFPDEEVIIGLEDNDAAIQGVLKKKQIKPNPVITQTGAELVLKNDEKVQQLLRAKNLSDQKRRKQLETLNQERDGALDHTQSTIIILEKHDGNKQDMLIISSYKLEQLKREFQIEGLEKTW